MTFSHKYNRTLNRMKADQTPRSPVLTALLTVLLVAVCISSYLPLSAQAMTRLDNQQTVDLRDMVGKGKWTIFEVWASDCPACPDGVFYMKEFQERYPQADLYGISVDGDKGKIEGRQLAQRFVKQQGISFPTILSSSLELDNFLYLTAEETLFGTPSVIIYNPQGVLKGIQAGGVIAQDIIDFITRAESGQ